MTTDPACHATMAHCISRGVAEKDAVAPSIHSVRTLRQTFECGRRRRKRCGDRQPSIMIKRFMIGPSRSCDYRSLQSGGSLFVNSTAEASDMDRFNLAIL